MVIKGNEQATGNTRKLGYYIISVRMCSYPLHIHKQKYNPMSSRVKKEQSEH